MRYEVTIAERLVVVEVDSRGGYTVDGEPARGVLRQDGGRSWRITLGRATREVSVLKRPTAGRTEVRVQVAGHEIGATVADPRARAVRESATREPGTAGELRAPMPGLVKSVHVAEGDIVAPGTALITLEAMKMENELQAPARVRIGAISASAGLSVERGALLLTYQPV